MLKTKTWILLLLGAALLFGALGLLLLNRSAEGSVVQILQDGAVIREIDLSRVWEEESFEITAPDGGVNTVTVRPGGICVSDADCPDRVCVDHGWLSAGEAAPIVCIPHRLVIQAKNAAGADGVAE